MVRGLMLVVFGGAVAFLVAPFVMTSRALDEHGVTIPGHVYHKSEYLRTRYSTWEVSRDVTIQYSVPETGGVSFFDVHPDTPRYDAMRPNQAVELRYLHRRDLPKFPLTDILWQIHALPTVRVVNPPGMSRMETLSTPGRVLAAEIVGLIVGLIILWRVTRSSALGWTAAAAAAAGFAYLMIQDFPDATRPPSVDERTAKGQVVDLRHIDKLFSGSRSRGIIAGQPIDVVGVEFVPQGTTEPVVAVDLIDRGSIPGLKEKATVSIHYESASPRTAYLDGATRAFPRRNLSDAALQAALYVGALLALLAVAQWLGRVFTFSKRPSKPGAI